MARIALLLLALAVAGCWRLRSDLPDIAPLNLARMAEAAGPAPPGRGVVVLDAEDEPAAVYEIAYRGGTVSYEVLLCKRTPCAVRLPVGRHLLAFVSSDEQTETRGVVTASLRPTVAQQYGARGGPLGGVILGVPLALVGSLLAVVGARFALSGDWYWEGAGVPMFLVGSVVGAGGALLVGWGASGSPAGVVDWEVD